MLKSLTIASGAVLALGSDVFHYNGDLSEVSDYS
jgi:hypothetical protein